MEKYDLLPIEARRKIYDDLKRIYDEYKMKGLKLDISRGKPNGEQLDFSSGLLEIDLASDYKTEAGFDCRNYGLLDGIPEIKRLFADTLGLPENYIMVGGNSSLQLMYDTLTRAMLFGVYGSSMPWCRETGLKWLCVAPGYDRHFRITETLGFELITVRMTPTGPDMDEVEQLVKDPKVKGIWCVPKYSNPSGNTYSDETVTRLARMECAAPDFRIMWDNAYAVHDFDENGDKLLDIFAESRKYGNEDRVMYYSSTSKVTYPGGGVAFMAVNDNNRKQISKHLGASTIGYDKLNQLRHTRYFKDPQDIHEHMMRLGSAIKEKFDIVLDSFRELDGLGIAEWTAPRGGYFISLDCLPGTAKRVFSLMKEAGVILTDAGATYPYGIDPEDKNLRIAPTYPSNDELLTASHILTVAVRMAAIEKLGM